LQIRNLQDAYPVEFLPNFSQKSENIQAAVRFKIIL
jgi:hypothetical protein